MFWISIRSPKRSQRQKPSTVVLLVMPRRISYLKFKYLLPFHRFGATLCLINNAGVMLLGQTDSQKTDEWSQMLDVNVKGVLNGCKLVLKGVR
jgi:NAD(P)-dependent dehydrogenase (short-subunit alcohol dehydrogenase family)